MNGECGYTLCVHEHRQNVCYVRGKECMYIRMYVCNKTQVYKYMHVCASVYVCACVCVCMRVCVWIHWCVYTECTYSGL